MNNKRIEKLAAGLLPDNYDLFQKMILKQAYANKRNDISSVALWRLVFTSAIKQALNQKGEIVGCCWHMFNSLAMYESGFVGLTPEDERKQDEDLRGIMAGDLKNQEQARFVARYELPF